MPPVMMTKVIPTAMINRLEASIMMLRRLNTEANASKFRTEKMAMITTRTRKIQVDVAAVSLHSRLRGSTSTASSGVCSA
jgi:hypothetical protein